MPGTTVGYERALSWWAPLVLEGREDAFTDKALEGLDKWIARFDDPAQPYVSRHAVKFMSTPSDYDHLARRQEWASGDADGGDE